MSFGPAPRRRSVESSDPRTENLLWESPTPVKQPVIPDGLRIPRQAPPPTPEEALRQAKPDPSPDPPKVASRETPPEPATTTRRKNKAVPLTDPETLELLEHILSEFEHPRKHRLRAEYYPYASLKHTIRLDRRTYVLRLSDLLIGEPRGLTLAAAYIMFARITGKPCPPRIEKLYDSFTKTPHARRKIDFAARTRGWKFVTGTRGKHRDLDERFDRLNREYFQGQLRRPRLTWSVGRSRRHLGQYDETFDCIAMNRKLDSKWVPLYVLDYVLFHEMLHMVHPARIGKNGRRLVHTKEFKKAERRFKDYDRAIRWLEKR